jgi:hypothetical protein
MIVKFIIPRDPEDGYKIEDLSINKEYEVIGIEGDYYRILNNEKEPCLYSPECFEILDDSKPKFWVTEVGADGEEYSYPQSWHGVGFFEDYFDDVKKVVDQFQEEYKKYYNKNNS